MGKSRLAHEWMSRLLDRRGPVQIWMAGGDLLRSEVPFGVLGQVIRAACHMLRRDPPDVPRQKLTDRIAQPVPAGDRARIAALLGDIADTPMPGEEPPEPQAGRRESPLLAEQIREAWEGFLSAECAAQPVLIVLEDLHWSDLPTVRLLDTAMRNL